IIVADASVEPVDLSVAADLIALGRAHHVLEALHRVVAVPRRATAGEVDDDAAAGRAGIGDDVPGAAAAVEGVLAAVAADDVPVPVPAACMVAAGAAVDEVVVAAPVELGVVAGPTVD